MIDKILVANRGEIAVRIIRTCKRMNIRTVAVYSEIDSRSVHVQEADEAFLLGPAEAMASYLNKEKIIDLALKEKCRAIHPGYGFLSENARFAQMVSEAGLVFIGPPAKSMALLGERSLPKSWPSRPACP